MTRQRFNNISLPADLAALVDDIMGSIKLGYKSRSDFVQEATRLHARTIIRERQMLSEVGQK